MLRFEVGSQPFMIRASLLPDISCLSFPENFQRARKNSVDLLPEIVGRRVEGVRQFSNERSFAVRLSDGFDVLFKMHGNRTNVILFQNSIVAELFRKNLTADGNLSLESFDREIDWSYEFFQRHAADLRSAYFTFGKIAWNYLEEREFFSKSREEQWQSIQNLLEQLNNPTYYTTIIHGKPALSLLKTGEVKNVFTDPFAAANDFYHTFTHLYAFSKEKSLLINTLRSKLEAGENYCHKNSARLAEVKRDDHFRLWGDLLMANMHAIAPGSEKAVVENFYEGQRPEEIRLKKGLTPQKNAEIFYRKAKNQHIEIERLESAVRQKKNELRSIREKIAQVEAAADLRSLRLLREQADPEMDRKKISMALPYHEFIFRDYRIWVGKNAQGNDILTFKYGYKEDLWLHAKDVAGSHVLVKHQAGKNFPKEVVEYAASIAAWNSKRKNESLCPVIVTPQKFVRKRKGDPAGQAVVAREEILLVVPQKSTK